MLTERGSRVFFFYWLLENVPNKIPQSHFWVTLQTFINSVGTQAGASKHFSRTGWEITFRDTFVAIHVAAPLNPELNLERAKNHSTNSSTKKFRHPEACHRLAQCFGVFALHCGYAGSSFGAASMPDL